MGIVADDYYAMSNAALWYAFRSGWTEAAVALIDRFEGRSPVPDRSYLPLAVVWAELLSAPICPFESTVSTDVMCIKEESHV